MPNQPLTKRTYLLVEDEYYAAFEMMACLEVAGARVLGPVAHLAHALEISTHTPTIDAAIVDVNLHGEMVYPFVDGLLDRDIAVVFVSGYGLADIPQQYQVIPFFQKPVDKAALIRRLIEL